MFHCWLHIVLIVSLRCSMPHMLISFETRRLNLVWSQKHIKFSILWIENQIFSFPLNEYCFWRRFQSFIWDCLFHCRWIVLKDSRISWNLKRNEKKKRHCYLLLYYKCWTKKKKWKSTEPEMSTKQFLVVYIQHCALLKEIFLLWYIRFLINSWKSKPNDEF